MAKAKDIMHIGIECISENEPLDRAAQVMRDKQVGALPICGPDNQLKGIITDRDIVVKCVAGGRDPSKMRTGDLSEGKPVFVESSADEDEILSLMEKNKIRRIPVVENKRVIGMISEADIAKNLPDSKLAHFVGTITGAPPSKVKTPGKLTG